jgi:hypothetical protein
MLYPPSSNFSRPAQRQLDLVPWGLRGLLHEDPDDHHALAYSRHM